MMNSFKKFSSKEELASELASNVALLLQEAIDDKGRASLLLSGGNTPKEFLNRLSTFNITWSSVFVGLVDERWVPNDHPDSNEFFIKENLLQNSAKEANFIGMYMPNKEPEECEDICSKRYKKMLCPFDVLILGMGTDSHTASLFPNNERLKEAYNLKEEKLCISILPDNAPHPRMSLSLGAILSSKNLILHIEGEKKLQVYENALKTDDIFMTPISAVLLNKEAELEVYYA